MDVFVEDVLLTAPFGREMHLRIRELPMADGVHASTGCQLWPASIALANELLSRPELVTGRRVLEVGAGCGLLGIAVASLARSTLLTDGDEEVVENLKHNIQLNEECWQPKADEAVREVSARCLRWEEALEQAWPSDEQVEVIVASDIIYG